jgi:hypothetical protein
MHLETSEGNKHSDKCQDTKIGEGSESDAGKRCTITFNNWRNTTSYHNSAQ